MTILTNEEILFPVEKWLSTLSKFRYKNNALWEIWLPLWEKKRTTRPITLLSAYYFNIFYTIDYIKTNLNIKFTKLSHWMRKKFKHLFLINKPKKSRLRHSPYTISCISPCALLVADIINFPESNTHNNLLIIYGKSQIYYHVFELRSINRLKNKLYAVFCNLQELFPFLIKVCEVEGGL